MRNNQFLKIITFITILIVLLALGVTNIILFNNNQQLQNQVELRDSTINEIKISDSILCEQSVKNANVIKKYIYDCGILINGKKVTTEELILYIKKLQDINDTLIEKLIKTNDSLGIYKSFYKLAKENLKVDYKLSNINNGKVLTLEVPKDTLTIYKILYKLAEKRYGFKYIQKQDSENLAIIHQFTKVDSAMIIYDYYKDKLFKNENGKWMVIIEKTKTK